VDNKEFVLSPEDELGAVYYVMGIIFDDIGQSRIQIQTHGRWHVPANFELIETPTTHSLPPDFATRALAVLREHVRDTHASNRGYLDYCRYCGVEGLNERYKHKDSCILYGTEGIE
jgi:hypothetical protein